MKDYKCDYCVYCQVTNDFHIRRCSYWNKMTFITDGCFRETTILDYDHLDIDKYSLDGFDEFDEFDDYLFYDDDDDI